MSLSKGDRVELNCTAPTTSKDTPLKLVYTTPYLTNIVCNQGCATGKRASIPCVFVSTEDKDCSQLETTSLDSRFYSVSCSSVLNSATGQHYLVIHLVIVQLRMEDINAHMFCETIPLQAEGIEVTQRRASIVKRLMFTLTPSIQDFVYDAKSFTWKCVALSIPPVQTGYIRFVSSTNTLMSYRMKSYSSVSTQSHPELPFSHLVPGFEAETNESMDFQSTITFVPKRSSLKTLPEGEVWMECRFAHLSRSLKTRIGTYDRLHDVPDPIHKTGGTYSHICVIPIQKNQTMKLVCLHRVIRYSWFDYDTTLLTVSVLNQTNVLSNPIATYIREKKLSGLWTVGHWPQVQVDLGEERMELLLVVEVLNNTEFDSGEYYCSFITTHRQQLHREVTSVLFRGKQKKAIFGQRYPLKNSLWFRVDVPADVGELIHSRCIAWTTNPENRELIRFGLSSGQQKQLPNETIRSFAEQPTMVTHMAEQYYTVAFDDQALARQCYAADQYMDLSKRLPVPSITCVVPDLYWEPVGLSNYERTMNLTCRTTSGCANAVFRWNWVAGPIPQLPSAATEGNRLGVIKGPTLYLASLSRSGAYVFRCTVTCACVSTTQSNSILVSFFMHVREVDDRGPGEDVPPDLIDTKPSEDDLARSLEREYWEKYSKEDVAHDGVDKAEQARIRRDEARSHELTRSAGPPEVGFLPPSLIPDELQQMKPSHVTDELDVLRSSASGYTELRDQLFSDIVRKFTESDFSGILTPPLVSRLVGDLPDAQQEREKYRQAARRRAYEQVPELHQYQQPYPISSPGAFETPTRSLYESELSKAKDELKLRRQDYSHMAKPYEAVLSDGLDVHLSIQHPTERDRTLIGPVDELPTGRRSPLECFEFTGDTEIGLLDLPTRAIYTRAIQRYEVPKMATTRLTSRAETRGVRVVDSLTPIYRDVPRQSDREPFRKARQVGLNADSGLRIPEALASKTDDMQSKISSYAKASEDRDYSGVYTHQQPGSVSEMPISTLDQPVSREYGIRSTRDRLGVTFRGGDYVRLDDRARGKRPSRMASETAKPHLIGDFEGQRAVKRFIELLRRDAYRRGGVMLSAHMPSPATEISDTELEFLVQTSMVGRDNIEFGEQVQHSGDYERLDMGYPEQLRRYGSRQVVPVSPTQEFSRHPEDETLGLFAKLKERLDSVLSYISSPESHASKPQRHTRYSSPDEQPQTYNLDDVIMSELSHTSPGSLASRPQRLTRYRSPDDQAYRYNPDDVIMSETTAKLVQIRKAFKPSRTPTMGEWGKAGGAEIRGRRKTTSTDDSKIATVEQHANRYGYDAFDRESPFIDQIHFSAQRMIDVTDEFTATTLTTPELVSDRAVGKPISKSLQIIPNIIRLPAQVTILCPMAPYNPRRGFTPTAISWSHATSTANFYRDKSERILYCPFATREHHVSIRYREPQRVFAYPPERWIDAYSLDIKPIRPDDYGYYACTFLMDIGRTGMVRTNFTKLAPYPLCIIPQEPSDASIVVKLSASQSKSTVDGEEDQCWAPNVAVMIRCETQAYQLFCEDADRTTDGYRLIRTVISASLITTTFAGHQSSIPLTADDEVPFAEPLEIGPVVSKTWTFPMQPEHHMTYVRCSCRPELIKPSLPPITYWEWLKNEFYQTHAPVMVRNSDAIKLCIKPAPVGIQVRPNPKSVSSDGDPMQLDLPPEAYIECVRHGDNGTTPDMHVYVSDRFNRTRHSNSGEDIHWNVSDGLRLNWPVQRQGHVARLRIPLTVNPGETYHIHCFTELTGPNHTFILLISKPASIQPGSLPVWQVSTILTLIFVALIVQYFRNYHLYGRLCRSWQQSRYR
ncbi:hypothetical protein CSKR_114353 [Clonorchis sinensis]|uniref:Uncharacterized protein n=1 Tax=Clonorchis sinensis TaxID=79923 RepID=A0A419QA45_CLOSI|nr:hypothetical protein CSKR_114353 [Clonorchis sinensis]